jgi:uncharacterized protein
MSLQVAQDALNWISNNAEGNKKKSIFFFGGEPMLRFDDLIKPLVEKNPDFQYSITTNGSLLTKERIDFLAKNNFSVMLSMDGNEETQNYNRHENSF